MLFDPVLLGILASISLLFLAVGCLSSGDGDLPSVAPEERRIVAMGDVHGDLRATLRALQLAGVVGEQGEWVGGNRDTLGTFASGSSRKIFLANHFP